MKDDFCGEFTLKDNSYYISKDLSGFNHGFFTKRGGISKGLYSSLNVGLGSRDDRENIITNRNIIATKMQASFFCTASQYHSNKVIVLDSPWPMSSPPKADGIVTQQKDILIGVLTADCGAVIFSDMQSNTIGVAHAGWRGASSGILENTILKMVKLGSRREDIIALQGATIGANSYQVGGEFHASFIKKNSQNEKYFSTSDSWLKRNLITKGSSYLEKQMLARNELNSYYFDLNYYISDILQQQGLKYVSSLNLDTYVNEDLFYSYRRSTHNNENDYARQATVIKL